MAPTNPLCTICHNRTLFTQDTRAAGICSHCRDSFGLHHPDRSNPRPPLPCRRCGHSVLIRCRIRERAANGGDYVNEYLAPMAVTFRRKQTTSFWSGRTRVRDAPDFMAPAGLLESFVCRRCGYVEWYAQDPADIPIGPEYGTELVDVGEGAGPFR